MSDGLDKLLAQHEEIEVVAADALELVDVRQAARVMIVGDTAEHSLLVQLRSIEPTVGIVVLARDPAWAFGAVLLAAGVTCVASNVPTHELFRAVALAASGRAVFVYMADREVQRCCPADVPALTRREMDVLGHLSQGTQPAAIALALSIGVRTVETYIAAIRRKLGVTRTRELIGMPVLRVRDK